MSGIGILYPGALGAALGRAIVEAGGTAITCLAGRSAATRRRAEAARFVAVPSLGLIASQSELVISLVPPTKAVETARCFAECFESARRNGCPMPELSFIDANSVSPRTKLQVAEILSQVGMRCLDGTFFGPANCVGPENVLLLSGPGADEVPPLLQQIVEVWPIGEVIGRAAAVKMALKIMTNGLCALFLEMVCASAADEQLAPTLELMRRLYPGTMSFLERSLPTYPAHVARRVHELVEVVDWLREIGQSSAMTHSTVAVLERLSLARLESRADWPFEDLLRRISHSELLRAI
jgi:3-hydroxyisobutyrate dehydrogenase-like beta-hydroxyacid dehydrogenase